MYMSKSWGGGKGDSSRVQNWESYRLNYDRIYRKSQKKKIIKFWIIVGIITAVATGLGFLGEALSK